MTDTPAPAPDLRIDEIHGQCPVQAEGTVNGHCFRFHARGEYWSMEIGGMDPWACPTWEHEEEYGDKPFAAGYMTEVEVKAAIEKAARMWAEQRTTPAPEIDITEIGGNCPVQAKGTIDGNPFYFRARGGHWSLGIGGDDPVGEPEWEWREEYGETYGVAGWMEEFEARAFIEKAARLWAEQRTDAPTSSKPDAVIIGWHTINRLRTEGMADVDGVGLIAAGDLFRPHSAPAPEIPEEMVEAAAVAIRESDACGEMHDGERIYCDDVRLGRDARSECSCKDFARLAIHAARVPALLARVAELEAALEPFGRPKAGDMLMPEHFDKARAALAKKDRP